MAKELKGIAMAFVLVQTIFILINLVICVYDFSFYRIPNVLLGLLLLLYIISAPFILSFDAIVSSAIVCSIVLAGTFLLFATKIIGGGDAKYLTVASLWAGQVGVLPFIFLVTLIGGFLAVVYLLARDHVQRFSDWVWMRMQEAESKVAVLQLVWAGSGAGAEKGVRENISTRVVPYGVAIATAAIIMIISNPHKGL
jgi:prepilin peptidase CpaA